jgi:hypothetical protein
LQVPSHSLLNVRSDCTHSELRSAYLDKVKKCHPDACSSSGTGDFLTVQSAWEAYQLRAAREDERATRKTATQTQEMVVLIVSCRTGEWTPQRLHALRDAIPCALERLHGAAVDVRRIERKSLRDRDRLDVHIGASSPRHRDAMVSSMHPRAMNGSRAFLQVLQECLTAEAQLLTDLLRIDECLPYSWIRAPAPV